MEMKLPGWGTRLEPTGTKIKQMLNIFLNKKKCFFSSLKYVLLSKTITECNKSQQRQHYNNHYHHHNRNER